MQLSEERNELAAVWKIFKQVITATEVALSLPVQMACNASNEVISPSLLQVFVVSSPKFDFDTYAV